MHTYGKTSQKRLSECDEKLQLIFNEAIKEMDISIICGARDEEAQNKAFAENKSKLQYPNSKHNKIPSQATDAAPYNKGIDWSDIEAFNKMLDLIQKIADKHNIKIRLGRDFSFKDYPHVELV